MTFGLSFKRAMAIVPMAISALALGRAAQATSIPVDPSDPFFTESLANGNTCGGNCQTVALGTDPISGLTTLEFKFYTVSGGGHTAIPSVVAGDVKVLETSGGVLGDIIRFENISGVAVAFIFSGDIGGGLSADVGLPSALQSNTVTLVEGVSCFNGCSQVAGQVSFLPTTGQPGYYSATGAAAGDFIFGLQSDDPVGIQETTVPEPATLTLLGAGLLGLSMRFRARRK